MNNKLSKQMNGLINRYLQPNNPIQKFQSLEDFIFLEENESVVDTEIKYLSRIKNFVQTSYSKKRIFVAPGALDEIVFFVLKNSQPKSFPELLSEISKMISLNGFDKKSLVIFPLHSFGFQFFNFRTFIKQRNSISFKHENFAIFPQTNSFSRTKQNIYDYANSISLPNRKKIDDDLFEHFFKSRSLKWFERNPILIFHLRFSQYNAFDNLWVIFEEVRFITNKLYFINSFFDDRSREDGFLSTKRTNNWETLDIHHFLTIPTRKGGAELRCLPVMGFKETMADLIRLNLDFPLARHKERKWFHEALESVNYLFEGYMEFLLTGEKRLQKYKRFSNSLNYFSKSIKSPTADEKIVNLNTAFEILLLDAYESSKEEKIKQRIWYLFKARSTERKRIIYEKLGSLIRERNSIMHNGEKTTAKIDFKYLHKLFCRLILFYRKDIKLIDSEQDSYITKYFESQGFKFKKPKRL